MKRVFEVMGEAIYLDEFNNEMFIKTKLGYSPVIEDPILFRLAAPKLKSINNAKKMANKSIYDSIPKYMQHRTGGSKPDEFGILSVESAISNKNIPIRAHIGLGKICEKCGEPMELHGVMKLLKGYRYLCPEGSVKVNPDLSVQYVPKKLFEKRFEKVINP